jgi:hypothetical protein
MASTKAQMDTLLGIVASGYTTRAGRLVQPSWKAQEALVDYYGVELSILQSLPKVQEILEDAAQELGAQIGGNRSGKRQRGGAFLSDMKMILNHLSAAATCVVKSMPRLPIVGSVTDAVIVNLKKQVTRPLIAGQQANSAAASLVDRLFEGITDSTDSTMKILLLILASTISGAALGVPGAAATLQLGISAGVAVAPSVAKLAALKVVAVALFKVTYSVTNGVTMVLGAQAGRIAQDVNAKFATFIARIDTFFELASQKPVSLDKIVERLSSIHIPAPAANTPALEEVTAASEEAAAIEGAAAPPFLGEVVASAEAAASEEPSPSEPEAEGDMYRLRRLLEKHSEREYEDERDILNEILSLTNKISPSPRKRDRSAPTREQVLAKARSILEQEGGRKTKSRKSKTKKRSIKKRRNTRR